MSNLNNYFFFNVFCPSLGLRSIKYKLFLTCLARFSALTAYNMNFQGYNIFWYSLDILVISWWNLMIILKTRRRNLHKLENVKFFYFFRFFNRFLIFRCLRLLLDFICLKFKLKLCVTRILGSLHLNLFALGG